MKYDWLVIYNIENNFYIFTMSNNFILSINKILVKYKL